MNSFQKYRKREKRRGGNQNISPTGCELSCIKRSVEFILCPELDRSHLSGEREMERNSLTYLSIPSELNTFEKCTLPALKFQT
jgi:hypothetical protein